MADEEKSVEKIVEGGERAASSWSKVTNYIKGLNIPLALASGYILNFTSGLMAALTASRLISTSLQEWAKTQYYTPQFAKLLGGYSQARDRLNEIMKISSRGPFKFDDLVKGAARLEILTRGAHSGKEAIQQAADAAAAAGVAPSQAMEAIGEAFDAIQSHMNMDGPIGQLASMGAISRETADKLKLLSAFGADTEAMAKALSGALDKNKGSAKALGDTIEGLSNQLDSIKEEDLSNIGEMFSEGKTAGMRAGISLLRTIGPIVQDLLRPVASLYNAWNKLLEKFSEVVAAAPIVSSSIKGLMNVLEALAIWLTGRALVELISGIGTMLIWVATTFMGAEIAAVGFRGAMIALGVIAEGILGPFAIAAIAIGVLTAALMYFNSNWKNTHNLPGLTDKAEELKKATDNINKVQSGDFTMKEKADAIKDAATILNETTAKRKKSQEDDALAYGKENEGKVSKETADLQEKELSAKQQLIATKKAQEVVPSEYLHNQDYIAQKALVDAGKADSSTLSKENIDRLFNNRITSNEARASVMRAIGIATGDSGKVLQAAEIESSDKRETRSKFLQSQEGGGLDEKTAERTAMMEGLQENIQRIESTGSVHASGMASVGGAMGEATGGIDQKVTTLIDLVRKIGSGVDGGTVVARQSELSKQLSK